MRLLTVVILFCLYFIELNKCQDNYGPYKMVWVNIETCKGPKRGDCGEFKVKNAQNPSDVIFRMDFPKDCPVTAAKIVISSRQKNNEKKKLWNYVLSKPCQHFVLGPILTESFNLTSNNCKINKGNYTVHLNLNDKSMVFLGSSFFYGSYEFKVMAFNKMNNFFCMQNILDIERIS